MKIQRNVPLVRLSAGMAIVLALALTAGCGDTEPTRAAHEFGHVHGLGVNPADQTLFAATHNGVFTIKDGSARLIADRRQDTMGFTVIGPDQFLASGRPATLDEPNPLGLIKSEDAAQTWSVVDFAGERDFHAIDSAGSRVYAYSADSETLLRSDSDGSWTTVARVGLLDIAVDPSDPDRVLATDFNGDVASYRVGSAPAALKDAQALNVIDWSRTGDLVGMGRGGSVWVSSDAGKTWKRRGDLPGPAVALTVKTKTWYAATEAGIHASKDQGGSWTSVLEH